MREIGAALQREYTHTRAREYIVDRYLRNETPPDLAKLLRFSSLEQRVHIPSRLNPPDHLPEPVHIELPLEARVFVV